MGKRKVTILEPAATSVAEIAFFIESKGLPLTAKKFVAEALNSLISFLMKESNTGLAFMKFGKTWITAVLLLRKYMLWHTSVLQRKLSFVNLFLHGY